METYLAHHGILGQKWGVRRYQNKDGSYTAAGKERRKAEPRELSDSEKAMIRRVLRKYSAKNPSKTNLKYAGKDYDKAVELIKESKEYSRAIDSLLLNESYVNGSKALIVYDEWYSHGDATAFPPSTKAIYRKGIEELRTEAIRSAVEDFGVDRKIAEKKFKDDWYVIDQMDSRKFREAIEADLAKYFNTSFFGGTDTEGVAEARAAIVIDHITGLRITDPNIELSLIQDSRDRIAKELGYKSR